MSCVLLRVLFLSAQRMSATQMAARVVMLSVMLALVGCGTWRGAAVPASPGGAQPAAQVLSPQKRHDVVLQAMAMLDRNYTYGGKKLHTGFDCSGLVSFVYQESAGVRLSGSAADMARQTRSIDASQAAPGDLVFFNTLGSSFSHVGIYIGDGKFIHAENEKTGVKTSSMKSTYWSRRFEGFRAL